MFLHAGIQGFAHDPVDGYIAQGLHVHFAGVQAGKTKTTPVAYMDMLNGAGATGGNFRPDTQGRKDLF